jgi:Zn-dependent protease with chaperone function/Flp pilus assembly protein TadD
LSIAISLFVGLIVALTLINLGFAWRQWREGRGSWPRLFCVCTVMALLQAAPVVMFILAYNSGNSSIGEWILPAGVLLVWNWMLLALAIGRPVRLTHSREELPLVDDEQFNSRVEVLAEAIGVRTPVVRLVRSLSGEQQAAAFAGGLPAPSLVVTDGILHRLAPEERDAIVAHELAHITNGSLWWLTCVTPVAAVGGLATAGVTGGWFAVLVGLSLRVGLLRIVSRFFERDCDRRAGEVIGFGRMHSALSKVHATHVLHDTGWRSVLVYATSTHPSRVERLAALEQAAPDNEQPNGQSISTAYHQRVLAARIAAALWCLVMMLSIGGRWLWPTSNWPVVLLIGVLTVPFWPLMDAWRRLQRVRKRNWQGGRRRLAALFLMAMAVAVYAVGLYGVVEVPSQWFVPVQLLIAACGLAGLLLYGGARSGSTRVRQQLLKALQNHDFEAAVRIGDERERAIRRVPEFRHNVAVARFLSGDRERGLADLEENATQYPQFVHSLLTLSSFHFDAGDYESALQAATRAADRLKRDPAPLVHQAAALWRLGRLDEAESAARRAIQLEPEDGEVYAVLAGVLIDRGDADGARAALETAERLSPGLPFVRVVEAEAALRFEGPDAARRAVTRAREAARANPFAVIDGQVARLEAELAALTAGSGDAHFLPQGSLQV